MENYTFVRISEENLHHLQALYKLSFKTTVPVSFFKQKFDTRRFGSQWLGFLAFDKDHNPAAYYGVFPCLCRYLGKDVLAAQSGDTMTHPDHRGKGLFTVLARMTYDLCRNSGVEFVFGFPNDSSYPGFIHKLDWKHDEDLHLIGLKISTLPLAKLVKKIRMLSGLYKVYSQAFLRSCLVKDTLQNSWLAYGYYGISHDERFFDYKGYNTSYVGLFSGKKVWFKIDGRLWIGDIEPCGRSEFQSILSGLKRLAILTGCTDIHIHLDQQSPFYPWFTEYGSVIAKNPIGYLDFNGGFDFSKVKFVSADFDTF